MAQTIGAELLPEPKKLKLDLVNGDDQCPVCLKFKLQREANVFSDIPQIYDVRCANCNAKFKIV